MALLRLVLLSCVFCTLTDCSRENEDFRIAAPSLVRFCNSTQHKVLFCVICNGFIPTCFSGPTPTASPVPTLSTQASTQTVATETTPTAATETSE